MRVTAETKAATRQEILDVAQRQFAQQGFEGATTRDIARAAGIGVGTLFNYFPTKESIVLALVGDAWMRASETFVGSPEADAPRPTLEEDLFAHVAAILRKLKPYRKYLSAVLETSLSPAARNSDAGESSLRAAHLEAVSQILCRHGQEDGVSPVALQLYWTLYMGVLAFWSTDASPRQEDTLALLDESLAMFVNWLTIPTRSVSEGNGDTNSKTRSPQNRG